MNSMDFEIHDVLSTDLEDIEHITCASFTDYAQEVVTGGF